MSKPDETLDRFWDMPLRDLLDLLEATPAGLTSVEAKQRLRLHGPNSLVGGISLRCSESVFCAIPLSLLARQPVLRAWDRGRERRHPRPVRFCASHAQPRHRASASPSK